MLRTMQCSSLIKTDDTPGNTDLLTPSSLSGGTFDPDREFHTVNTQDQSPPEAVNVVSCTLNYDTFPTILFHYLPLGAQRLIAHRVRKSSCPLFVLVTSSHGQWCLVQLVDDSDAAPDPSSVITVRSTSGNLPDVWPQPVSVLEEQTQTQVEDNNRASPSADWSSETMNALQISLDDRSVVEFSGTSAVFHFRTVPSDSTWRCPFCGASFAMGQTSTLPDILVQHIRRHVELRCCVDCITLLPNSSTSAAELPHAQPEHQCSQLVSPTRKSETEKSSLSLIGSRSGTHRTVTCMAPTVATVPIRIHTPSSASQIKTEMPVPFASLLPSPSALGSHMSSRTVSGSDPDVGIDRLTKSADSPPAAMACGIRGPNNPIRCCSRCGIYFKSSAQYQQHLKNVHRGHRFLCQECDASFSTKGNLTTHFQQVHNRNAVMRCPICDKRLSNKYNIERHMRFVHSSNATPNQPNPIGDASSLSSLNASDPGREPGLPTLPVGTPKPGTNMKRVYLSGSMAGAVGRTATRDPVPTANVTGTRGFYLYLSSPDQTDLSDCPQSGLPCHQQAAATSQRHLVAEVQMTPCPPSNPDAQYGSGGTTWHPCIRVAEPWLVTPDAAAAAASSTTRLSPSSSCPPP